MNANCHVDTNVARDEDEQLPNETLSRRGCLNRTFVTSRMLLAVATLAASFLTGIASRNARAEIVWIEGEKPVRSTMNRHPWWYDQVKKDQFSGGDFLSNFSEQKSGEAEYSVKVQKAGDYQFWVRGNPVKSQLSYRLNGGEWKSIKTDQNTVDSANVAADGKPDLRFLAWIKVGPVALKAGDNSLVFRCDGQFSNHGYLDCFVLANEPFQPRGKLRPEQLADTARQSSDANRGWFEFAPPPDKFLASSGFDLRELNEKFAGEGGFIGVKGSEFVHRDSGRAVRFWAVNGPPEDLRDPQELRRLARLLAKYGVNLVRVHGAVFDDRGEVDPKKIQHAHDVVAAMKSEGIYCHFSIYFPLWLKPKPDNKWLVGYDGNKHPFAALFFNRDFQRQYVSWWKALLTTPDERTGKKLIDEPAVMGLELQNEDSYFFWTFSNDNIPDAQLRILESQYVEWLEARYGTLDAAMRRWNGVKAPRDAPGERRLGFRPLWNMFSERSPRDQDAAAFLLESQRDFYHRAHEFVHKLGFKGVVTCSNWTTASPQYLGPLEKYTYTQGDFIDRHGYFGCNHRGQFSEWSIRDGHTYGDRSALRFDAEQPGKPRVLSHPAIDPSYDDKPSMISETTWNRPNRFRSEAPLYFAAYGALQDTDAIVHFALDGADWNVKPRYFMQPWTLLSPAQIGQFPAAALLYRQRMIEPGAVLADMTLDVERLKSLAGTPLPQDAALDELRLKDVPQGQELAAGQLLDPLLHYAGRVIVRFQNDDKSKQASVGNSAAVALKLADLKGLIDHSSRTVTSSHRQLKLDYGRGALVIDAPQVQGASGNVAGLGRVELPALTIESPLDLIHIIAVSLDGRPLTQSRKLLLQVMTEEQATNFRTEPAGSGVKKIVCIGENPWLAREIRGTVRFTRSGAERLKVTPLDHAGYPTGAAKSPPLVARELTLQPTTMYYLVTSDE